MTCLFCVFLSATDGVSPACYQDRGCSLPLQTPPSWNLWTPGAWTGAAGQTRVQLFTQSHLVSRTLKMWIFFKFLRNFLESIKQNGRMVWIKIKLCHSQNSSNIQDDFITSLYTEYCWIIVSKIEVMNKKCFQEWSHQFIVPCQSQEITGNIGKEKGFAIHLNYYVWKGFVVGVASSCQMRGLLGKSWLSSD